MWGVSYFFYTRNVFAHNLEIEIKAELKESVEYTHSFATKSRARCSRIHSKSEVTKTKSKESFTIDLIAFAFAKAAVSSSFISFSRRSSTPLFCGDEMKARNRVLGDMLLSYAIASFFFFTHIAFSNLSISRHSTILNGMDVAYMKNSTFIANIFNSFRFTGSSGLNTPTFCNQTPCSKK